jgi:predicted phosphohydrolase
MKVAASCDIHYDLLHFEESRRDFDLFLESLISEKSDVLILAGDLVGLGWSKLRECLDLFQPAATHRMMVFGNHDYWCADKNSLEHLRRLEKIIEDSGFFLLDEAPVKLDNIGFAGNSGWYDYSLAAGPAPPGAVYEKKEFLGRVVWNDANFIRLNRSDEEYTKELIDKLEKDITFLENQVDSIIAVTHHLAFREMLTERPWDILWTFNNAFMGSHKLGAMLLMHPKVIYHICGHSHNPSSVRKSQLESINPGSTYTHKRYITLNIV